MDQVRRQWTAAHVGADKINTWDKVATHLVRKNSIPYDRNRPHQPHNFMHNKLVVADDVVVTGSFNLSNHAMGNTENVLLIHDAGIASQYADYIQRLQAKYGAALPPLLPSAPSSTSATQQLSSPRCLQYPSPPSRRISSSG